MRNNVFLKYYKIKNTPLTKLFLPLDKFQQNREYFIIYTYLQSNKKANFVPTIPLILVLISYVPG